MTSTMPYGTTYTLTEKGYNEEWRHQPSDHVVHPGTTIQ